MNDRSEYFDGIRKNIDAALSAALPPAARNNDAPCTGDDTELPWPMSDSVAAVSEPCRALLFSGGKRWRPLLFVLSALGARSIGEKKEQLRHYEQKRVISMDDIYRLSIMVELVHTASLIHDDIEDGAITRRGVPCAHVTYGVDVALNSASWLYFKAASVICNAPLDDGTRCRLYSMYVDAVQKLHEGQALDISWHKHSDFFPTVEQYMSMTAMKTGALAGLAASAGALVGGADEETAARLKSAAVKLGVSFQALDDAQNIIAGNPGKERGDDIVEGKKSLPVLLHLQSHPQDKERIIALFGRAQKEGISSSAVAQCVELLTSSGAAQKAREWGIDMGKAAVAELRNERMQVFACDLLGLDIRSVHA